MKRIIRFTCPDVNLNKKERIEQLFCDIDEWISSDYLRTLIELFGGKISDTKDLKAKIEMLNVFADVWDYRKKQAKGGERWEIKDDDFLDKNDMIIYEMAKGLGLISIVEPVIEPDYILPLGGARMANLDRCVMAKQCADKFSNKKLQVIALSGKRPINDIELPYLEKYSPYAKTEYDAINSGLEKAFNLERCDYIETNFITENMNMQWSKRDYYTNDERVSIHSIAAPSSDSLRRANSLDTFEFFLKTFDVKSCEKILLVTSCIYVPFQFIKFMQIAFEKNLLVDCVGVASVQDSSQFSNAANYLQEIKGTINAIKTLSDKYL